MAWLDGRDAPRRVPHAEGDNPRFGRGGEILFRVVEKDSATLYRISDQGERREKVAQVKGAAFGTVSPDGQWLSGNGPRGQELMLHSTSGKPSLPVLPSALPGRVRWSFNGKVACISIQYGQSSAFGVGRTYVLPLADDLVLPSIPPEGFRSEEDIAAIPGVEVLPHGDVALGP